MIVDILPNDCSQLDVCKGSSNCRKYDSNGRRPRLCSWCYGVM